MPASTIQVMGLRIRIITAGDGATGVPVLLIHGVGAWAENFREVMAPIAASGRRAIAMDLPGFGESQPPPAGVAHFGPSDPFYPRFVVALMDTLGLERAHLVGSSMGGAIAYMAAVSAPPRFPSLTLAAPGGLGHDIALFLRVATLPGLVTLSRIVGDRGSGRTVLRTCFYDASRIPPSLFEEVDRYGFASFPEFVRALRAGVTLGGVRRDLLAHWTGLASRYDEPVLVVWGREDAVLPIAHLAGAKDVFPQAELKVIERCGHLPMIERTDEFLAAVLPFLDRAEHSVARHDDRQVAPLTANG